MRHHGSVSPRGVLAVHVNRTAASPQKRISVSTFPFEDLASAVAENRPRTRGCSPKVPKSPQCSPSLPVGREDLAKFSLAVGLGITQL